jgi:hypothetical protein
MPRRSQLIELQSRMSRHPVYFKYCILRSGPWTLPVCQCNGVGCFLGFAGGDVTQVFVDFRVAPRHSEGSDPAKHDTCHSCGRDAATRMTCIVFRGVRHDMCHSRCRRNDAAQPENPHKVVSNRPPRGLEQHALHCIGTPPSVTCRARPCGRFTTPLRRLQWGPREALQRWGAEKSKMWRSARRETEPGWCRKVVVKAALWLPLRCPRRLWRWQCLPLRGAPPLPLLLGSPRPAAQDAIRRTCG